MTRGGLGGLLIRLGLSAALLLPFVLALAGAFGFNLLDRLENASYDARLALGLSKQVDPRIVIVDMDEKSLAAEGWPWPRAKVAALTEVLTGQYGVRALGFDIIFSEPDAAAGGPLLERLAQHELADLPGFPARAAQLRETLDGDRELAQVLTGKPVMLGFFFKKSLPPGEVAQSGTLCAPVIAADAMRLLQVDFFHAVGAGGNLATLQAATPYCGFFDNPAVDEDGVFRRVPLLQEFGGQVYPSLALELTRLALADEKGLPPVTLEFDPPTVRSSLHLERIRIGTVAAPVDGSVAVYVPYRGRQGSFRYVSATDVLHGTADAAALKGAIVLVGTTAAGLLDARTTPFAQVYPGVEVHANIVSGLLDNAIRQKAPYYNGVATVMLVLIALVMALFYPRLTPLAGAGLVAGLVVVEVGLALALWSGAKFIVPLGLPLGFTFAVFMLQLLYGYFVEQRLARTTARKFGQYVHPALVEEMAASGADISMEGETRQMTVLFSDIRGFTAISEKMRDRPQELAEMMNLFLGALTDVVQRHRGTLDKYVGDLVMAFWGAPLKTEDHALNALRAALEFPQALRALDEKFAARGWPALQIGVGVNSGTMTVGNMGTAFRVAYTVLGDAVNLGSRLEGLTKEYGVPVICGEATRAAVPDWGFRELDQVRVVGKREPVAIYEPLGPKDAVDEDRRRDLTRYRQALRAYRARQWDEAEREFFGLSRSGHPHPVYEMYLARIATLRAQPPGADWDGVYTFRSK